MVNPTARPQNDIRHHRRLRHFLNVDGLPRPQLDEISAVLAKLGASGIRRFVSRTEEKGRKAQRKVRQTAVENVRLSLEGVAPSELPARVVIEINPNDVSRCVHAGMLHSKLAGLKYNIEPLFSDAHPRDGFGLANHFLVTLPLIRGEVGKLGHDLAYALREVDGVRRASYERVYPHFSPLEAAFCPGEGPEDKSWSKKVVRLPESLTIRGEPGGSGIVIGHPDTGWAEHTEIEPGLFDLERQWSTFTQKPDAKDPMNFPLFKGHGTATASVLAGRTAGVISGVAPGATIIPIRCVDSVAVVLDVELARAVWYACRQSVHVISMSVGGHAIPWLEGVIAHAVSVRNIIVCAAAGNATPFVVYPAAYPDCIAVASSTPTDRPAASSSYGPEVTISAPGHKVWEADFVDGEPVVKAGCGTSFATPHVAGAAALWLHRHGRENLLDQYKGKASLQEVFKLMLRRTARNPGVLAAPGAMGDVNADRVYAWNTTQYGAGILNIQGLLEAPLPRPDEASTVNPDDWAHTTWNEIMYGRFHDLDPQQIEGRLHTFFQQARANLDATMDQFGAELTELVMNAEHAYTAFGLQAATTVAAAGRAIGSAGQNLERAAGQAAEWARQSLAVSAQNLAQAAEALEQALNGAGEAASGAVKDVVAAAEETAEQAASTAEQVIEETKSAAEDAAAAGAAAASAAAETAEEIVQDVGDTASDTLKAVAGLFG
jgi:hypothetical protein